MPFNWPHASRPPVLEADAHVWAIPLDIGAELVREFERLLSPDELDRARAFRVEGLGPRFVAAHAAMRIILGQYLNERPERIQFGSQHRGKPCLGGEHSRSRLRFNLSHSADLALLAIVNDCEVGVDVEQVREVDDLERLVERYFHPTEIRDILSAESSRNVAFFRHWTAKEAVLKAFGSGITERLDHFQVPPSETVSGGVDISAMPSFVKATECNVTRLEPCENFHSAVALVGPQRGVRGLVFDI